MSKHDPNKVLGEIWGRVLSDVRGARLPVHEKVALLDEIANRCSTLADSVRSQDFDARIETAAREALDATRAARIATNRLNEVVQESKLHKTNFGGADTQTLLNQVASVEVELGKAAETATSYVPSIVERVATLVEEPVPRSCPPAGYDQPVDGDLPF
jgi:uncharacterized protein Yka (UPF0111/DUF47 family)